MDNNGVGLDWSGLIGLLIIAGIFGFGGGFGFNGNTGTALGLADIQASLYNQTQDASSRQIQGSLAMVNDTVLNNKYDNAILIKDLSNQMSNSIAAIGNQINQQTATITGLFNEQTIDRLRDQVAVLRNENSNLIQTAQITENILGNLSVTAPKMTCAYPSCGCGNSSLY